MNKLVALSIALECVSDTIHTVKQDKKDFLNHVDYDKFLIDYRSDRIRRYDDKIQQLQQVLKILDPLEQ